MTLWLNNVSNTPTTGIIWKRRQVVNGDCFSVLNITKNMCTRRRLGQQRQLGNTAGTIWTWRGFIRHVTASVPDSVVYKRNWIIGGICAVFRWWFCARDSEPVCDIIRVKEPGRQDQFKLVHQQFCSQVLNVHKKCTIHIVGRKLCKKTQEE